MAILVFSPNGTHVTKPTLEVARTSADCAGKTVVVTTALTAAQSDITAAWPADRALEVKKGGSIANTAAFTINGSFTAGLYKVFTGAGSVTGLREAYPDWFGSNTTPGVTDMSSALQAAILAADTLNIPVGVYMGSLTLSTTAHKTIKGLSRDGSILRAKDNSTSVISLTSSAHYSTISNLTIDNPAAGNNGTHYGIYTNAVSTIKIDSVYVSGFNNNLHIVENNDTHITGSTFSGAVYYAGITGANLFASGTGPAGPGLWITDSRFLSGKYGIYLDAIESPTLTSVEVLQSSDTGLFATNSIVGAYSTGPYVSNGFFDSSSVASVYLSQQDNAMFGSTWISGSLGTSEGLVLSSTKNSRFDVNVKNTKGYGIHLTNASVRNSFTGVVSNNLSEGIHVNDGCYGNTFSGMTIADNVGYNYQLLDVTAQQPNIITGGYVSGAGAKAQTKDIITGTSGLSGQTTALVFSKENIPDGTTGDTLVIPGATNREITMPRSGAIVGLSVALNDTIIAGTLNFNSRINGVNQTDVIQLSTTAPQYGSYIDVTKAKVFAAGDRIGVLYGANTLDTTGAASTVDAVVAVWVVLD